MRVRRAAIDDAGAAAGVMATVAAEGFIGAEPPVDIEARTQRFRDAIASEPPAAVWVLEDAERVLGYAAVTHRVRGVLDLGMAIVPDARGRGGGRALLDAVIEHGEESEAHKLELEAWLDNGRAIAMYAAAGFEVEGLRRDHYRRRDGSLRSSLIMARRLDAE